MTIKQTLLGSVVVFVVAVALSIGGPVPAKGPTEKEPLTSHRELHGALRMLWEEHIVNTRNAIISSLADRENTGPITERLLRNQDKIGNAFTPFYGEAAGKQLSALLRNHILIAATVVEAAKIGDANGVAGGRVRWRKNADEIAVFLGGANPNWPVQTLRELLYRHIDDTTAEVVSRLERDRAADSDRQADDQDNAHMLMFADALTDGILKQRPGKFRK